MDVGSIFTKDETVVSIRSTEPIAAGISGKQTLGATDITAVLPVEKQFTRYIVTSPNPTTFLNHPAFNNSRHDQFFCQLAIAAVHDDTVISILVNNSALLKFFAENSGKNYTNNTFKITLHRLQSVFLFQYTDLSGIMIQSSKPVALFSAVLGLLNPSFYLMEQLPPVSELDVTYIVPPNHKKPETVIKVISEENTVFTITSNNGTKTISLIAGVPHEIEMLNDDSSYIQSQAPILVTSMTHRPLDLAAGDMYYTVVPGMRHYQTKYKNIIPQGWTNHYIAVMITQSSIENLRVNGQPLNNERIRILKNNIAEGLDFSVIVAEVEEGELTLESNDNVPFGLMVYGSRNGGGYGFAGSGFR